MKAKSLMLLASTAWLLGATGAQADYTIELRNGRLITVRSYREEAGMIKFGGLGGEIGLAKDQVLSIRPAKAADSAGFNIQQAPVTVARPIAPASKESETARSGDTSKANAPTPEEERAKEEKEYQDKVRDLTAQIKEARNQYSEAIRGTTGANSSQLLSDRQIQAHNDDVTSRLKEAQSNPSPPAPVQVYVPSPFISLPPTVETRVAGQTSPDFGRPQPQTPAEQALTDMRRRAIQLEQQRDQVINEMRQKNFETGSLFLE